MPFWKTYHIRLKIAFLLLLCLQLYQSIQNRQERSTNFGCEICSDKVGYFVYLPIWFDYGLDSAAFPQSLREMTHEPFSNPLAPSKTFTKFTSGVALMLSPFYLAAKAWYGIHGQSPPAFSHDYLAFTNFGLALYLTLALAALFVLLRKRYDDGIALLTLIFLFFGTNLIYYVLDESLMSHAYSFCLFAYSWFFLERALEKKERLSMMLAALFVSWAVLVRPTNILGIPLILFLAGYATSPKIILTQLLKTAPFILISALIIWIPQVLYWKLSTGHWLVYSYQNEGFHHWKNPALGEQWLAVKSGILPYAPGMILLPLGILLSFRKAKTGGLVALGTFILCSYIFASWASIGFGDCNFGYRPFVEFLALWSPAIASVFYAVLKQKSPYRWAFAIFILVSIGYTNHMMNRFDTCFFGKDWDYVIFIRDYFS